MVGASALFFASPMSSSLISNELIVSNLRSFSASIMSSSLGSIDLDPILFIYARPTTSKILSTAERYR